MNARSAVALTAAVLALLAAPALAAPPACYLLNDARGDGTTNEQGPSRDALDIVSGDVATGRRTLVAVLRLASLRPEPTMSLGATYVVNWRIGKVEQEVLLYRYSGGQDLAQFDPDVKVDGTVPATAVVDAVRGTITWTVPRAANPALKGKGLRLTNVEGYALPSINVSAPSAVPSDVSGRADLLTGDDAWSAKVYVDRMPSCLRPA